MSKRVCDEFVVCTKSTDIMKLIRWFFQKLRSSFKRRTFTCRIQYSGINQVRNVFCKPFLQKGGADIILDLT